MNLVLATASYQHFKERFEAKLKTIQEHTSTGDYEDLPSDMFIVSELGAMLTEDAEDHGDEPTDTSKQPIRNRYLGHVTGYEPIRDQYFLIRSVPDINLAF
eukprot:sb/3478475/